MSRSCSSRGAAATRARSTSSRRSSSRSCIGSLRAIWRASGPDTCSRRRRSSMRPTCGWWTGRASAGRIARTSSPWRRRSCATSSLTRPGRAPGPSVAPLRSRCRCRRPRRCRSARASILVALDDALKGLEGLHARQSRVVELRFFGGLDLEETAHVLGVSVGTVRRDWSLARAWLYRELHPTTQSPRGGGPGPSGHG